MIDWTFVAKVILIGFSLVMVILTSLAGIMVVIERIIEKTEKQGFVGSLRELLGREVPEKETEMTGEKAAAIFGAVLKYVEKPEEIVPSKISIHQKWVRKGRLNLIESLRRETPKWTSSDISRWKLSGRRELISSNLNN